MQNECAICFQAIPDDRTICEACEKDRTILSNPPPDDAERLFKERQARAMTVE